MNKRRIYYEVKTYLDYLGEGYINKVPKELYNYILSFADEYQKSDNFERISLKELDEKGREILSKEARIVLFNLDYSYFTESEEEKEEMFDFIKRNENVLREDYGDNLFSDRKLSRVEIQDNETLDAMYGRIKLIEKYLDDLG